jgi:mannose-6-phosphate isomerase-like protein (cupin superfamily)
VYVVLEGSGRVKLDDEIREVGQWDAVRVGRDTMRCFEGGPEGIAFVVVGAPKTPPGDAEIVQGWWSDEG